MALDFGDQTDFEDANRGFVASLDPVTIKNPDGRVVFDLARTPIWTATVRTR